MDLLTGLLTLPLAPVRGVVWIAEQVDELARDELDTRADMTTRLAEIEAAWEAGEISDEHREELEERLLRKLWRYQPDR